MSVPSILYCLTPNQQLVFDYIRNKRLAFFPQSCFNIDIQSLANLLLDLSINRSLLRDMSRKVGSYSSKINGSAMIASIIVNT